MEHYPSSAAAAELADRAFPLPALHDDGPGPALERLGPLCDEHPDATDPDSECCFRPADDCGPGRHRSFYGTRW